MKKRILFIINPISGTGKFQSVVRLINEHIQPDLLDYKIVFTKAPKHATELSRGAVNENYDMVVAVGGDGTVLEVGKGLVGTNTALGILARGSGNGFARNLKIPMEMEKALDVIAGCKTRKVDTVFINDEKYLGVAGVGFDALVAWEFSHYGKRGLQSYIKIVVREIAKYQPQVYDLIIDGKEYKRKAFFITFANSSHFGGNAVIAPNALINDGIIDVCLIDMFPLNKLPILAYMLFTNTLDQSRYVEFIRGKEIIVKQNEDYVQLDGDPYLLGKHLHLKINPMSLNVVVPGHRSTVPADFLANIGTI